MVMTANVSDNQERNGPVNLALMQAIIDGFNVPTDLITDAALLLDIVKEFARLVQCLPGDSQRVLIKTDVQPISDGSIIVSARSLGVKITLRTFPDVQAFIADAYIDGPFDLPISNALMQLLARIRCAPSRMIIIRRGDEAATAQLAQLDAAHAVRVIDITDWHSALFHSAALRSAPVDE